MADAPEVPPNHNADELEHLLVELLDQYEAGGAPAVEPLLAAHPQHQEKLRRHLSRLLGLGLVPVADCETRTGGDAAFPERLGDFRLLQRLGGGGMGVVYLAEQLSLGRRVALKLIRPELLWFDGARDRFRREVDSIARLQHPGIVPVFAAGEDQGVPWLAMEHVVGATLDEVLQMLAGRAPDSLRGSDLQQAVQEVLQQKGIAIDNPAATDSATSDDNWPTACVRIVRDVARALQHAHRRGVLHRDVKPGNVVLTSDGRALLLDFGLASAQGSPRLTASHGVLGSPAYMSPEQLRGEADLDGRSDVYSLGLLLYELLTHHAPYAHSSAELARSQILTGSAPPPRTYNRSVPRDVEVVCKKAIDVERRARYADAQAFALDLDNLLTSRPIAAVPPGPLQRLQRWTRRHPARAIGAVAAFLLLFLAPTVFLLQQWWANEEIRQALAVARRDRDRGRAAVEVLLQEVATEELFLVPRMQQVRRRLLQRARGFHEDFLSDGDHDADATWRTADSALQVALLDLELGHATEAQRSAERAVQLATALQQDAKVAGAEVTFTDRRLLARSLTMRGKLHQQRGELTEARNDLDAACRLLDQEPGATEAATLYIARLSALQALAVVLRQLGATGETAQCSIAMDAAWRQLLLASPSPDQVDDALECHLSALVDRAYEAELHHDHAMAATALDRYEALVREHPESAERLQRALLRDRMQLELVRAELAMWSDQPAASEQHSRNAIDIATEVLTNNPENANALRMLSNAQNNLMVLLASDDTRQAEASALLNDAIDSLRRLSAADPDVVENRANLAASLANRGSMLLNDEQPLAAAASFREARELLETALAEVPTRSQWSDNLYKVTWFVGQAAAMLGDHGTQRDAATRLCNLQPDDAKTHRIAAGLLATAVAAAAVDDAITPAERPRLDAELKGQAMTLLRRAAALGCTDFVWLRDSDEFAPLRDCDGYAEVLQQVSANQTRDHR